MRCLFFSEKRSKYNALVVSKAATLSGKQTDNIAGRVNVGLVEDERVHRHRNLGALLNPRSKTCYAWDCQAVIDIVFVFSTPLLLCSSVS